VKRRGRDPAFLAPILALLGGSPTTILKKGGCCFGVNRLFIPSLDTIGIRAALLAAGLCFATFALLAARALTQT